jgi:hypothetical protein
VWAPVSWGVCVCVGAGILGGVDVSRWLPGVPALVEGVDVGRRRELYGLFCNYLFVNFIIWPKSVVCLHVGACMCDFV